MIVFMNTKTWNKVLFKEIKDTIHLNLKIRHEKVGIQSIQNW